MICFESLEMNDVLFLPQSWFRGKWVYQSPTLVPLSFGVIFLLNSGMILGERAIPGDFKSVFMIFERGDVKVSTSLATFCRFLEDRNVKLQMESFLLQSVKKFAKNERSTSLRDLEMGWG